MNIEDKYKWDLTQIFASDEAWEEAFTNIDLNVDGFNKKIESAKQLFDLISMSIKKYNEISKLAFYSHLKRDLDLSNSKQDKMYQRIDDLETDFWTKLSFMGPRILELSSEEINCFLNELPELKEFEKYIDGFTRMKKHILSEKEEKILVMTDKISSTAGDVFTLMNNLDFKFGEVNGIKLTHSSYIKFLMSKDRGVREEAYKKFNGRYLDHKNGLGALFNASVKKHIFYTKARKYENSVEKALYPNAIDVKIFDNLIEVVNDNLHLMHDYFDFKKKVLEVDEFRMWDAYVYLADVPEKEYSFDNSFSMVKDSLQVMGSDYVSRVDEMFSKRRIDVYPVENKVNGAYNFGSGEIPSFVLLNHKGILEDVFTLSHELGHAMHFNYTMQQPLQYRGYSIFLAEIASTVNEQILSNHLISNSEDEMKAYLLNQLMSGFKSTIFRQTKFAEFEKITHSMVENNEPLNTENLREIYSKLNKKYYGNVVNDDEISMEWSRIPHFYNNFYVYAYATGLISSIKIAKDIQEKGPNDYIEKFLKVGTSKYPLDVLKEIGLDLTDKKVMQESMDVVASTLKEFKKVI